MQAINFSRILSVSNKKGSYAALPVEGQNQVRL